MAHNIALNFEDGVTRFITCGPDDTVADASFRAGINIPLDCRDGACGTCKCRAESGDFDAGSYIEDALTRAGVRPRLRACLPDAAPQRPGRFDRRVFDRLPDQKPDHHDASGCGRTAVRHRRSPLRWKRRRHWHFCPGNMPTSPCQGPTRFGPIPSAPPPAARRVSFLVRDIPQGVMSSFLRDQATPGTPVAAGRAVRQLLPARHQASACCSWPAAPAWRRSCPCLARSPRPDCDAADPPDLRRDQRRRPRGGRSTRGLRRAHPRLHLRLLRRRRGKHLSAQRLRHGPYRTGPSAWRRRRYLSLRAAADGRGGARLARRSKASRRPVSISRNSPPAAS